MKLNNNLGSIIIGFLMFAVMFETSAAIITTEVIEGNSDSWVAASNQKGIKLTCTPYEYKGKTYLKVKFENTTNQIMNFSWSLSYGSEIVVNFTKASVPANGYIETDYNTLIHHGDSSLPALYSFNIKNN